MCTVISGLRVGTVSKFSILFGLVTSHTGSVSNTMMHNMDLGEDYTCYIYSEPDFPFTDLTLFPHM